MIRLSRLVKSNYLTERLRESKDKLDEAIANYREALEVHSEINKTGQHLLLARFIIL
jgi:hypothetical protein